MNTPDVCLPVAEIATNRVCPQHFPLLIRYPNPSSPRLFLMRQLYTSAKEIYDRNRGLFSRWPLRSVISRIKSLREKSTLRRQRYRSGAVLRAVFTPVLSTPPLRCNPDAATEIHTLTARRHVYMYITAVKSFLRYFDDVAIVTHDDGSLATRDKRHLTEQIPGIRIINRSDADRRMAALFTNAPHCARFRRRVVNSMELFDNILLARSEKIMTMNSDVLFLEEPREVIQWIRNDESKVRIVYEEIPARQREFLAERSCGFPPHVTLCLVCFYKKMFDLEYIERIVAGSDQNWFTAQNIYPLLFGRMRDNGGFGFFDKDRYQSSGVFPEGAAFRHYWTSTGQFTALQSRDSSTVIGQLADGAAHTDTQTGGQVHNLTRSPEA